jgi:hypothetical protein
VNVGFGEGEGEGDWVIWEFVFEKFVVFIGGVRYELLLLYS